MAFLWGKAGEKLTQRESADRQRVAQALMAQASDTSPVGHWTAALNRGLQGYLGGRQSYLAREGQNLGQEHAKGVYEQLAGSGGTGGVAAALAGGGAPTTGGGAVTPVNIGGSQEEFINALMPYALQVQEQYGIAPEITLAQAALETGWGKSAPGNNFFGIKSHGKSGGNTLATTEVINGQPVRVNDSFRAYESPGDSVLDYGRFLSENPRYKAMLAASGDLEAQIDALGRSGYATDPNYASKIRSIAYGIGGRQGSVADTSSVAASPAAGGGSANILAAMSDPYVADYYGPQLQAMLGQSQARENAVFQQQLAQQDPAYQLSLERGRLEIEQLRNPQPQKAPETNVFFDESTGQEYRAQWNPNTLTWDRIGGTKAPSGPLVNIGTGDPLWGEAPKDHVWLRDSSGNVITEPSPDGRGVIPVSSPAGGTKAASEAASAADKAAQREDMAGATADTVVTAAKRALDAASSRSLGVYGQGLLSNLPWTQDAETSRQVETLKSIAAAENINAMRQASPTGGALGNASDADIKLLKDKSGALDPSSPNFDRDMKDYARTLLRTIHGVSAGDKIFFESFPAEPAPAPAAPMAEDDASILMSPELNPYAEPAILSGAIDFTTATMDQLLDADITALTAEEQDAWEARLKELQSGR